MHNIVFITPTMLTGGAERMISLIGNYLCNDFNIYIYVYNNLDSFYKLDNRIHYRKLNIDKFTSKNRISAILTRIKVIRHYIKDDNIDAVICINWKILFLCYFSCSGLNKTIISSERSNPFVSCSSKAESILRKLLAFFSDGFVFQTKGASKFFFKRTQKKGIVIPNPVIPNEAKREIDKVDNDLFCIGRFIKGKDHFTIFKALAILKQSGYNLVLHVYGDGPLKNEYLNLLNELDVLENVKFEGNVSNIKKHIRNHKIYILTSLYEGMPNSLIECMSLGIPCIATNCQFGPSDLIENDFNGILIDVGSVEQLVESIKRLYNDSNLCITLGKNALNINNTLSIDSIGLKWTSYLNRIIKKG